jgi:hypothetical protein
MDLNLALAVLATESVEGAAEHGSTPYFWPMRELVSFLISECDLADPIEAPALAAIQAEPDLARERAAEIDAAVAQIRARAPR